MIDQFSLSMKLLGLLYFFAIFLWIAFKTYRPSAKKAMNQHALIPFQEEPKHE